MRKIDNPSLVTAWNYFDDRLGKGYAGTRDHIIMQVQTDYLNQGVEFREQEIPARIDDFMCAQGLASPCSESIDGLGDIVHAAIKPFIKAYEYVTNSTVKPCSSCNRRRQDWNEQYPL